MKELGLPMGRALEVGAGPGRSAIELSKAFDHVDAGDYSQSFVDIAQKLIADGEIHWTMMVDRTANTVVERSVSAKDLEVGSVSFSQMDALALPKSLTGYDLICGFNLIDRLAKPKDFLLEATTRLNPGGLLVIASPYTWLEEFTDRSEWLGAFKYGDNDGPSTYVGLKEFLGSHGFEEVREPQDVWFRLDELANGRKSQQTSAQMTFWRQIVE
jgi:putative 4-mercaptohistidine N1-methyltranferase